jgi:ATP-dependent DNA helicase DinG
LPGCDLSDFAERVLAFFDHSLPGREGYENRPEQRRMALAVADTIENGEILIVEAGTGTGKSLAYLIPSLLWASQHGMPVIVSTRTLNLQQQLLDHDLPGLSKILGRPFRAIAARGWSNYLCLRRLHGLAGSNSDVELTSAGQGPELERALLEIETQVANRTSGIRQEMRTDDRIWPLVCADSASCNRQLCPHYEDCYFFRDRRLMDGADLIVTNHSLLLADLALRREGAPGVLPAAACIVIDEGHHLEDVANEHLARTISSQDMARLQQQVYQPKGKLEEAGLLPSLRTRLSELRLETELKRELLTTLDRELLASMPSLYQSAEEFFAALSALVRPGEDGRPAEEAIGARISLDAELLQTARAEILRESGSRLGVQLERAAGSCSALVATLQAVREDLSGGQEELKAVADRLRSMSRQLEFCLFPDSPDWVYWAADNAYNTEIGATPLDVGDALAQDFFAPARSVVITSATLAVGKDLSFYASRVGLDRVVQPVQRLCLDSPFNYRQQAYLGVAHDLPEPNSPAFLDAVLDPLCQLVERLQGRTFLLLTSMSLLRRAAARLRQQLDGIEVLAQGEASNRDLLRDFRSGRPSILLGADSFWEGVDVPGDALQCVVMARLPFRVPTDPLVQAHCKRMEEGGQNAFYGYQLPRAILRFRQGFGRLIRTSQDRGMVLVLDSRIYHKSYGKEFTRSLPSCTRRAGPWAELVPDSLEWLGEKR